MSRPDAAAPTPSVLRLLLDKIEQVGSGSPAFWHAFQAVFSRLSHAELERLALACGERGRIVFRALTDPSAGRS